MSDPSKRLSLILGVIGLAQLACFAGLYFNSMTQPAEQGGTLTTLITAFLPLALVGLGFVGYAWFRLQRRK